MVFKIQYLFSIQRIKVASSETIIIDYRILIYLYKAIAHKEDEDE